jgi:DNA-directed RNA polymerase subunit RPC12/RpoP
MPELADIFRACAPGYLVKYGKHILPSHKRAITDIVLCRTRPLGGKAYYCEPCEQYHYSYHSCKNRACPKCGNDDATKWLTAQSALLLPVPYFLVTSTLPAQLRPLARCNQKRIYGLLLRCTAEAIAKLAQDPEWVGGHVGLLGVLQTWKRNMEFHVHAHFIVPGGGLSPDGKHWLPAQRTFLMPNKAVATILRAKFRDALKKLALSEAEGSELFEQIPEKVWRTDWVVDIEPVGKGKSALKYLAPYIFRVAISNKRIVSFKEGKVTFRWQDNKGNWHTPTIEAEKFISRFLQHVLPKRFVKVRYYGFFSPRKRQVLSGGCLAAEVRVIRCPECGSKMLFIKEIKPDRWRAPPWPAA